MFVSTFNNIVFQEHFATSLFNRDLEASFGTGDGELLREDVPKFPIEEYPGAVIGVMMTTEFTGRNVTVLRMDVMLDNQSHRYLQ